MNLLYLFSSAFFLSLCALNLSAQTNVVMQHNDIGRTGQNTTETALTPSSVSSGNFGKLYTVPLDGQAYAQPLYLSSVPIGSANYSVVFAVTQHDSVYALDANANGSQLWKASLLDAAHGAAPGAIPDPETDTFCADVTGPEYGIMGTPVIDASTGTLYAVSLTYEGSYPVQRLHALDVTTGNEKFGGPVTIQATAQGTGSGSSGGVVSFDPKWENQRPGLLLLNGTVYIGWAAHCDFSPWHGWIIGYDASTLAQTTVYNTTPNGGDGGIWMSGAGLAADNIGGSAPRMFVATGNGTFDSNNDYSDSIVRLNLLNGIQYADSFTPSNQAALSNSDSDLGAGGVLVLPDNLPGSNSSSAHLAVQLGKPSKYAQSVGVMYIVNRDNLGGYSTTTNNVAGELTSLPGLWAMPAYWNNSIYFWPYDDSLRQYSVNFNNGQPSFSLFAQATQTEPGPNFIGTTPSISANGATNGIVWSDDYVAPKSTTVTQVLYAHDATNVGTLLWSSAQNSARDSAGFAQKWAVPTVADGKVFLTALNSLVVYGMLTSSVPSSGLQFVPTTPCRVADTRNADGAFGGPILQGGTSRTFVIPNSACNVPASAQAYALNVTVVPSAALSYLTVWPSGQGQPGTSLLNSDGRIKANAAIVGAGTSGGITLYATDDTDAVIDISGYFVPAGDTSALTFYPIDPYRCYDTRIAGQGAPSLTASQSRNFVLGGMCGVPAGALAYSVNLTAIPQTTLGYLSAWPAGAAQPGTSVLNSDTGTITANAAIVQAGANDSISVFATDNTDLLIDINGYFLPASSGGLSLYTMAACRAQDTRLLGNPPFSGILKIPIFGSPCTVPSSAQGYVLNATVVPAGPLGYLALWPDGLPLPGTSNLNAYDAATTSNMAIVGTSNGVVDVFASDPTQLILDISAYFAP